VFKVIMNEGMLKEASYKYSKFEKIMLACIQDDVLSYVFQLSP